MIWFDYHTDCAATRCIGDFTDVTVINCQQPARSTTSILIFFIAGLVSY